MITMADASAAATLQFGCPDSITRSGDVFVQGNDGFFFRQKPDLDVLFPISDHVVDRVALFSRVLAARGTTLFVLPIPARGTVMGRHIDGISPDLTLGFDVEMAKLSYQSYVNKLKAAGVKTLDLLPVLESTASGTDYFLPTDHHWNANGARETAKAFAKELANDVDTHDFTSTKFTTHDTGDQLIISAMRRAIQLGCKDPLPANFVKVSETLAATQASANEPLDIFGSAKASTAISLTGTSFSDVEAFNFAGFISEFTGLDVTNFAVSGGNQFVSILSYVTSGAFAESPPKILIWENPVYNNLGEFGDLPLDELIAAGSGACKNGTARITKLEQSANSLSAFIPAEFQTRDDFSYLEFDAGSSSVRKAEFQMVSGNGDNVPVQINRSDRFKANGRFYLKIPKEGLQSLKIISGGSEPATATLTLCKIATK